jgi:hypothetical protein
MLRCTIQRGAKACFGDLNRSFASDRKWPVAGAPAGEIDATLLTFKIRSDRPVWGEQFRKLAVTGRPGADTEDRSA